ncbi:hypothetical protein F5Y16DRAFT_416742 [Xylariaceae sp. FL0255]|nr:hypothetical protein F5Y16DRAFT_416742 [Xylariaceae sp. FL0255]
MPVEMFAQSPLIRVQYILKDRATASSAGRLFLYPPGCTGSCEELTYTELYSQALQKSEVIRSLPGFRSGRPVLLHLPNLRDAITWFWAVLLAEGLPVPSPPFSNGPEPRNAHIAHLSSLLEAPACITSAELLPLFTGIGHDLTSYTTDELDAKQAPVAAVHSCLHDRHDTSTAVLMLTSGSTGLSKAVQLTHRQILSALASKSRVRPRTSGGCFLS